eukprot:gene359-658_t
MERTDLMKAVSSDDLTLLFELLNSDSIDLFAKDDKGRTALDWARICKNDLAIAVLIKAMDKVIKETRAVMVSHTNIEMQLRTSNENQRQQVLQALYERNCETILKVVKENRIFRDVIELSNQEYFIDVKTEQEETALMIAAGSNHIELVDLLLDTGIDINHVNIFGHSALTWAAVCGHGEIIKKMLSKGANPFQLSPEGRTALHYACLHNKAHAIGVIFEYLFNRFGTYRDTHPVGKVDPMRWLKYAIFVEDFIKKKDKDGFTAVDLLPSKIDYSKFRPDNDFENVLDEQQFNDISRISTNSDVTNTTMTENSHVEVEVEVEHGIVSRVHDSLNTKEAIHENENHTDNIDMTAFTAAFYTTPPPVSFTIALVNENDTNTINSLFYEAEYRIGRWKATSEYEISLLEPIKCWYGCDYRGRFEHMFEHTRNQCLYRLLQCYTCLESFRACDLKKHENFQCNKRRIMCPNAITGCCCLIPQNEMDSHLRLRCLRRLVLCRLNCDNKIPFGDREKHEENFCKNRIITCDKCKKSMSAKELRVHTRETCPHRLLKCGVGCGLWVKLGEKDYHEKEVCCRPCKWDCGQSIGPIEKRRLHELQSCPSRICLCRHGCGTEGLTARVIHEHQSLQCPATPVTCPHACGVKLTRTKLLDHCHPFYGDCRERFVRCPSNLVGWKVAVWGEEGLVLQYRRFRVNVTSKTSTDLPPTPPPRMAVVVEEEKDDDAANTHSNVHNPDTHDKPESDVFSTLQSSGKGDGDGSNGTNNTSSSTTTTTSATNDIIREIEVDRFYIRFEKRQAWIDIWGTHISPIEKVSGRIKVGQHKGVDNGAVCGWIPYGDLSDHLVTDCPNRPVWLGGGEVKKVSEVLPSSLSSAVLDVDVDVDVSKTKVTGPILAITAMDEQPINNNNNNNNDDNNMVFIGQRTTFATAITLANKRVEVNELRDTPPTKSLCSYCLQEIPPEKLDLHMRKTCVNYSIRCSLGCGVKLERRELDAHLLICPKRSVHCESCKMEMWAEELSNHLESQCIDRIIPCPRGCDEKGLIARFMDQHTQDLCEMRSWTCQCNVVTTWRDKSFHMIVECPLKLGACPQHCGLTISREKLDWHLEKECKNKEIFFNRAENCPLNCGRRMRRKDILEHVSNSCPLRLSSCPNGCGNTFKMNRLQAHLLTCPKREICCTIGMKPCNRVLHMWFYKFNSFNGLTTSAGNKNNKSRIIAGLVDDDDDEEDEEIDADNNNNRSRKELGNIFGDGKFHKNTLLSTIEGPVTNLHDDNSHDDSTSYENDEDYDDFSDSTSLTLRHLNTVNNNNNRNTTTTYNNTTRKKSNRRNSVSFALSNLETGHSNLPTDRSDITENSEVSEDSHKLSAIPFLNNMSMQNNNNNNNNNNNLEMIKIQNHTMNRKKNTLNAVEARGRRMSTHDLRNILGSSLRISRRRKSTVYEIREDKSTSIYVEDDKMNYRENLKLIPCIRHGITALMYAIRASEGPLLEHILRLTEGEDIDLESNNGDTALTIACRLGKISYIEMLLENGADINIETESGRTALIEATRGGHIPVVELLIRAGADVTYKSRKYGKSALGWARQLGLMDLLRTLEIGAVVQAQLNVLFNAISCGDLDKVKAIVADGEPFHPLNTVLLRNQMEKHFSELKIKQVELMEVEEQINKVRNEVATSTSAAQDIQKEVDASKKELDSVSEELHRKRKGITKLFETYEKAVHHLHPADLEEIARLRDKDELILIAALGCGVAMGILPIDDKTTTYSLHPKDAYIWWPRMASEFQEPLRLMTKMQKFSWASLQGMQKTALLRVNFLHSLCDRMRILWNEKKHHHVMKEISHRPQQLLKLKEAAHSVILEQSHKKNNDGDNDEDDDDGWDSDAEGAGDGEWIKGEWVPKTPRKTSDWFKQQKQKDKNSKITSKKAVRILQEGAHHTAYTAQPVATGSGGVAGISAGDHSQTTLNTSSNDNNISSTSTSTLVNITTKNIGIRNISSHVTNAEYDENETVNEQFVDCVMVLLNACEEQKNRSEDIVQTTQRVHIARQNMINIKKKAFPIKQRARTELSSEILAEKELTERLKFNKALLRKANLYRDKLRISRLLNQVSSSGHTALSYAASYGFFEAYDLMLMHGSSITFPEDYMHMSAILIQVSYRLTRVTIEVIKAQKSGKYYLEGGGGGMGKRILERLFELRSQRERLVRQLRYRRRTYRMSLPEAAYSGHWEIIHRTIDRGMFQGNACNTWIHPCPPPPHRKISKKLNKGQYMSLMECLTKGVKDLSVGAYIVGQGWVPPGHPLEPFGEAVSQIVPVWNEVLQTKERAAAEKIRLAKVRSEMEKQKAASTALINAIKLCDFKECINIVEITGASIDIETPDGITVLIVAAEENISGLHHVYMTNDDGKEVLAVEYLLDREYHRPHIDLETSIGLTALSHASYLGRGSCVESLLDRGADINRPNKRGETAMHAAASNGSLLVCRLLIERGADLDAKDVKGRTPYDMADVNGFIDIMGLISQVRGGMFGRVVMKRGHVTETVTCVLGCGDRVYVHEMDKHCQEECSLSVLECPLQCGENHIRKELQEHMDNQCANSDIICNLCEEHFYRSNTYNHNNNECMRRVLYCPQGCGHKFKFNELEKHFRKCSHRLVPCPDGCNEKIPFLYKLEHLKNNCKNRKVPCTGKCCSLVLLRDMNRHLEYDCSLRMVQCRWCDEFRTFLDNTDHELICPNREIPCKSKCGKNICIKDMKIHLKHHCIHRFIPCELHCELSIRLVDMSFHISNECGHRLINCPRNCIDPNDPDKPLQIMARELDSHLKKYCDGRTIKCVLCQNEIISKSLKSHKEFLCPQREVKCSIEGCTKRFPFAELDNHERYECLRREVTCPQGCNELILAFKLKKHMTNTCIMRYEICPLKCGQSMRIKDQQRHMDYECVRRVMGRSTSNHTSSNEQKKSSSASSGTRSTPSMLRQSSSSGIINSFLSEDMSFTDNPPAAGKTMSRMLSSRDMKRGSTPITPVSSRLASRSTSVAGSESPF